MAGRNNHSSQMKAALQQDDPMEDKDRGQGVKRRPSSEFPVGNLVDIDDTPVTKSPHGDSERERDGEREKEGGRQRQKEREREREREKKRDGGRERQMEGAREGERDGGREGEMEGGEGERDGGREGEMEVARVGERDGGREGEMEVARVGERDGGREGEMEWAREGERDGVREREMEGAREGERDGGREGEMEGAREGERDIGLERERGREGARAEEEKRSCCSLSELKKVPKCYVELEPLSFSRTHTVLIDVNEIHPKSTLKAQSGQHVWNRDFVKMPCSPESLIKTGSKAIKKYNPKYENQWSFDALHTFVQEAPKEENYYTSVFPKIAELASRLPHHIKKGTDCRGTLCVFPTQSDNIFTFYIFVI
ncbi:unnamed protein product [Coregonus sp. 'balchen']|nr:unnamed protein product [Coregonus sp. 'balchen']